MAQRSAGWDDLQEAQRLMTTGHNDAAMDTLGKALLAFKREHEPYAECYTLQLMASIHNSWGNFEQSIKLHRDGLEVAESLGFFNIYIVQHLDGLGTGHSNIGNWEKAIEYYQRALDQCDKPIVALREFKGSTLTHLANAYARYTPRSGYALELYNESLAIHEEFNDRSSMGYTLAFMGQVFASLDNHVKSLECSERARHIAIEEDDNHLLSMCYAHLAGSYQSLNKLDLVESYLEKAIELDKEIGNKQGLNRDYLLLGELHEKTGREDKALVAFEEGLLIARSIKDYKNILIFLNSIADIYSRSQKVALAEKYYNQALELCRQLSIKREEINIQISLAALRHLHEGITTINQALETAETEGYQDARLRTMTVLARIHDINQNYEDARQYYEKVVNTLEAQRSQYTLEEYGRAFSERYGDFYERLVDLHIMFGDDEKAFVVAEQSRDRILNNIVFAGKARPRHNLSSAQQARYFVCFEVVSSDVECVQRIITQKCKLITRAR